MIGLEGIREESILYLSRDCKIILKFMASTTQVKDGSYFIQKIFSGIDAIISIDSWVHNRGVCIAEIVPYIP